MIVLLKGFFLMDEKSQAGLLLSSAAQHSLKMDAGARLIRVG